MYEFICVPFTFKAGISNIEEIDAEGNTSLHKAAEVSIKLSFWNFGKACRIHKDILSICLDSVCFFFPRFLEYVISRQATLPSFTDRLIHLLIHPLHWIIGPRRTCWIIIGAQQSTIHIYVITDIWTYELPDGRQDKGTKGHNEEVFLFLKW